MKIDYIFLIVFGILIAFSLVSCKNDKIEKMSNVSNDIKEGIRQVYLADVDAIRNLSEVAKKLQTGGITNPGNLTVSGALTSGVLAANDNISVTNGSNEGGRLRILNSLKNGKAGQTNDWSIWNMTGGYGNKLSFWRYNGDGANAGPVLELNDNGNVNTNGNLRVAGELQTPNGHTIRSDGRQHITGGELLYLLPKSGVVITKDWGASGDLQVHGTSNMNVVNTNSLSTNTLSVGGVNIRDFVPVVINFNAPGRDHSYQDRTFPFNQKSVAVLLWPIDGNFHPRYHRLRARLQSKGVEVEGSVRHIADFRSYIQVSVSIPPGKMVKFWNWGGLIRKFKGGHHHLNIANFDNGPHMMWIGYEDNDDHIPDSYNLAGNNGGW